MKTCILFPGQGAQSIGMGKDFYEANAKVRELFDLASHTTKINLKTLIFEGNEEDLKQTRNTQVSLALVECAAALCLADQGVKPAGAAGFSLGEWPALVEAGILSFETMIRLVGERGRLMDEAGKRSGGSTMAAVMNLEPAAIEAALKNAGIDDVWVANYNSPAQSVISGTESGMDKAEPAIKVAGAKRVIRLKVSGAFHSPIMKYAFDGFKELLTDVSFAAPKLTFFSNVSGKAETDPAVIKQYAADQIVSPVRWIEEQQAIIAAGFELCLEAGPGTVLTGLWKSASTEIVCKSSGSLALIQAL
ncbi:MAG: [acyl-carrier-protein] S-malonyltransferase [Spirochaetes bacterium GWD1_61_31]|nr:MAG: [acyl-carrier-protein] S-malonyltransferase [Spirochaetes bacterium GWB1_60_80]OHD28494.1 MAG: [acyl-carrier-protein] S-malonyltransferase [Spirochaetes bacterium GWC1_61_12]OHD40111.1 MAG: [acyl-carrier-protein] S-malonyltransferase [Spirochaetes bacterium GWD1_61_31]OHD45841.1 MAG: [acyl-carrier-protein] S-malonyltransferase [Spirochaetes bacterium GWE1_60_18]OHD58384.1 MAG: [acyl-carrier-protein] S-malonyltransferase [Spirochaetes bacterium GWF1_60_12]HAW85362.1 [acyl-carrier-protei